MKFKATKKEILEGYGYTLSIGYCAAQSLLHFQRALAYTSGVYGWNADVYECDAFPGVAIVSGYRPFGYSVNYDLLDHYEKEAAEALKNTATARYVVPKILDAFVREQLELIKKEEAKDKIKSMPDLDIYDLQYFSDSTFDTICDRFPGLQRRHIRRAMAELEEEYINS